MSPKLVVGSDTGIGMGCTISAAQEVSLGKHVVLARNVYISDHGHAFEDVNRPISVQGIRDIRPVQIGDETWLGQNVCVLPGVRIGKHCVVGAGAVVTRDVPDFSVAVGCPAVVIRRFNPEERAWEAVGSVGRKTL
jgi:acetyltransferase-like isoleucine patch superfamily enzyme